jgi:hypothetical protein
VWALLKDYVAERIRFYTTRDAAQVRQIDTRTAQLQRELWSTTIAASASSILPSSVLPLAGMNSVLNSQADSQAAWWKRIPKAAWYLMVAVAVCCHVLIGYGARNVRSERVLQLVLPLIVSIAFCLIADLDSPRSGIIRVHPDNLQNVARSFDTD